jgi:hypothetical protein
MIARIMIKNYHQIATNFEAMPSNLFVLILVLLKAAGSS